MPNVTTFYNSATDSYFSNCLNLKSLHLQKATFCPTINLDVKGIEAIENGVEPELSFVYAPNAITVESSNLKVFLQYYTNLDFVFIPKATGIQQMAEIPNSTWYFSEAMEKIPGCEKIDMGDVAYEFELVNGYRMRFIFWEGDEEFPPSAQILYSDNFQFGFHAEDMVVAGDLSITTVKMLCV